MYKKKHAAAARNVYQFKLYFVAIEPLLWRQFTLSQHATFWDCHIAIQDCLGWQDKGLHEFIVQHPSTSTITRIALVNEGFGDYPTELSVDTKLATYFSKVGDMAYYHYPLGAEWQIKICLEKKPQRISGSQHPCCLGGERLSPPEPDRGQGDYNRWPRRIAAKQHPQHQQTLVKLNAHCDSQPFDGTTVRFTDPMTRLQQLRDKNGNISTRIIINKMPNRLARYVMRLITFVEKRQARKADAKTS